MFLFIYSHNNRKTQWIHPTTKLKYRVPPCMMMMYYNYNNNTLHVSILTDLPYGWQLFKDDDDVLVYVE